MRDRPVDDVPQCVEVQVQVESHRVIEPKVFVVDRVVMNHAQAEGDGFAGLAPDEELNLVRHALPDRAEEFLRQLLEVHG